MSQLPLLRTYLGAAAYVIVDRRSGEIVTGSRPYRSEKAALAQTRRYGGDKLSVVLPVYWHPPYAQ